MSIPLIDFKQRDKLRQNLEIIELSTLYGRQFSDHHPEAPHRLSFFMLVAFKKGEGKQMVDFKTYEFTPGTVINVQREQVTAFDLKGKPEGKILIFNQAFLDDVHANMRLPNFTPTHLNSQYSPALELDGENQKRTFSLINEMNAELTSENGDPLIVMYLFSALTLLHRRLRTVRVVDNLSPSQSRLLALFFALLQQHFEHTRDANWYADQLATTYKTLNRVCKVATSLTVKQMIDSFTITEIKRRLVVSKITSQQLAYDFGFEDPSNFVKYFKKATGQTPHAFRNHHQ